MSAMEHFTEPTEFIVRGDTPAPLGDALALDGDAIVWRQEPGVAARIVDLLLGRADSSDAAQDREEVIPVDQTHTSVIVDGAWVVKMVASWGAADRSAKILSRLQRAGSVSVPTFLGSVQWDHPTRGQSTVALVSEYVEDSDDGWTWAPDDVVAHIRDGAPAPDWPARLGELAARMHGALTEPSDAANARASDRNRALETLERTVRLVQSPGSSAESGSPGLRARLTPRIAALRASIESIPEDSDAQLITPHGDLHVGQVLRTAQGRYFLLDFDGDPQWTAERRQLADGAARDIAHLLVSIDLVGSVAQRRLGGPDARVWEWAEQAERECLNAYENIVGDGFLDHRTLEGLKAEQLCLELSYSELFRPEWSYAPDGVVTHRYPRESVSEDETKMEPPWNPPALSTT